MRRVRYTYETRVFLVVDMTPVDIRARIDHPEWFVDRAISIAFRLRRDRISNMRAT
jgi:hypothetical protein